jgi:5S rRNA maturation endonuclease (ribonuclease M5)
MITRDMIFAHFTFEKELERLDIHLDKRSCCICPFHEEKTPSCHINLKEQFFRCFGCDAKGSIIDFRAMMLGKDPKQMYKEMAEELEGKRQPLPPKGHVTQVPVYHGRRVDVSHAVSDFVKDNPHRPSKEYFYKDAMGRELYKVVRYENPKDFRPFHPTNDGHWQYGIEGIQRVLYNLRAVMDSDTVIYVEGEKDADTLNSLGFVATTHVCGSKSWLEPYNETLRGKHVVLCGDNDEAGREMMEQIFKSISLVTNKISRINLAEGCKDISEQLEGDDHPEETVRELIESATIMVPENDIHMYSCETVCLMKKLALQRHGNWALDLGEYIPSFKEFIPPIEPGGVVVIMGETGKGKTLVAQNIVSRFKVPTCFFQMEMQLFNFVRRFLAIKNRIYINEIKLEEPVPYYLDHMLICDSPGLTTDEIERRVAKSALLFGEPPKVVVLDYIQLVKGTGYDGRIEAMSKAAEELKTIAKRTNTVIIIISQIARREKEDVGSPIGLYNAKYSGSIENSAELVLGIYRDPNQSDHIFLEALKNTHGPNLGQPVRCYIQPGTLILNEACEPPTRKF